MTQRPPDSDDDSRSADARDSDIGYPRQEAADEDPRIDDKAADREATKFPAPGSLHAPFANGRPADAIGLDVPEAAKVVSPAIDPTDADDEPAQGSDRDQH
jgi:hypothetical protein